MGLDDALLVRDESLNGRYLHLDPALRFKILQAVAVLVSAGTAAVFYGPVTNADAPFYPDQCLSMLPNALTGIVSGMLSIKMINLALENHHRFFLIASVMGSLIAATPFFVMTWNRLKDQDLQYPAAFSILLANTFLNLLGMKQFYDIKLGWNEILQSIRNFFMGVESENPDNMYRVFRYLLPPSASPKIINSLRFIYHALVTAPMTALSMYGALVFASSTDEGLQSLMSISSDRNNLMAIFFRSLTLIVSIIFLLPSILLSWTAGLGDAMIPFNLIQNGLNLCGKNLKVDIEPNIVKQEAALQLVSTLAGVAVSVRSGKPMESILQDSENSFLYQALTFSAGVASSGALFVANSSMVVFNMFYAISAMNPIFKVAKSATSAVGRLFCKKSENNDLVRVEDGTEARVAP